MKKHKNFMKKRFNNNLITKNKNKMNLDKMYFKLKQNVMLQNKKKSKKNKLKLKYTFLSLEVNRPNQENQYLNTLTLKELKTKSKMTKLSQQGKKIGNYFLKVGYQEYNLEIASQSSQYVTCRKTQGQSLRLPNHPKSI